MRPVEMHAFLEELARLSGEAILPFFRTSLGVIDKGRTERHDPDRFDPVTEADRAAETVIRRQIRERFPTHGILGEEFDDERLDAEYVWVIDPIDGTRAFICGLPVWGTLIGLKRNGTPVLGVMNQPYTGEMFIGDGKQAQVKGPRGTRILAVSGCTDLANAKLMTTDPRLFKGENALAYARVESAVKLTRFGTDCYAYTMLAAGQVDLVIEAELQAYDIVGLIPVIEGAGGVITTWEGAPATDGGRILAAATQELHKAAMAALSATA